MRTFLILFIWLILFVVSCSIQESAIVLQKKQVANQLFSRINSQVRSGDGGSSSEWLAIENRIYENRDTLFYVQTSEYKILVQLTDKHVIDSLTKIQDSIQTQDSIKTQKPRKWW